MPVGKVLKSSNKKNISKNSTVVKEIDYTQSVINAEMEDIIMINEIMSFSQNQTGNI